MALTGNTPTVPDKNGGVEGYQPNIYYGVLLVLFLGGGAMALIGYNFPTQTSSANQLMLGPQLLLGGIVAIVGALVVLGVRSHY